MSEELIEDNINKEVEQNKKLKLVAKIISGVIILIVIIFAYKQFIWNPSNEESMNNGYVGINYADKDSTDLAIEELQIHKDEFDGKIGGEVSQFVLARQLMEKGEFDKALEELEGVEVNDTYVQAMSVGLQGDCYSEKKDYVKAAELYLKASKINANDFTSPQYLFKAGLCAEESNDFAKAAEFYQEIKDEYNQFASQKSIDKYLERAKNKSVK